MLHISYLHFKGIYYVTTLLSALGKYITLLFSYFQQNAQISYIEQVNRLDQTNGFGHRDEHV